MDDTIRNPDPIVVMVWKRCSARQIFQKLQERHSTCGHNDRGKPVSCKADAATKKMTYDALSMAVHVGFVQFTKLFLANGYGNICLQGNYNLISDVFGSVCKKGNIHMLRLFAPFKPDLCVHYSDRVSTYDSLSGFELAMSQDNVEILELFLQLYNKQKKNIVECSGQHATLIACRQSAFKCLKYLVQHFPREVNGRDIDGATPLLTAVRKGHHFVKLLLEHKAGVKSRMKETHDTCLHLLFNEDTWHDKCGYLPEAAVETCKLLLAHGADVNAINKEMETPLYLLIQNLSLTDNYGLRERMQMQCSIKTNIQMSRDLIDTLLDAGASLKFQNTKSVFCAMVYGYRECIRTIGDFIETDLSWEWYTAYHLKWLKPALEILETLISKGADPNDKDPWGKTPLTLMFELADRNEDVPKKLWYKHMGSYFNECVKFLLLSGARDINVADAFRSGVCTDKSLTYLLNCLPPKQTKQMYKDLTEGLSTDCLKRKTEAAYRRVLCMLEEPKSLSAYCRITILNSVKGPFNQVSNLLGLPPVLVEYLCSLKD